MIRDQTVKNGTENINIVVNNQMSVQNEIFSLFLFFFLLFLYICFDKSFEWYERHMNSTYPSECCTWRKKKTLTAPHRERGREREKEKGQQFMLFALSSLSEFRVHSSVCTIHFLFKLSSLCHVTGPIDWCSIMLENWIICGCYFFNSISEVICAISMIWLKTLAQLAASHMPMQISLRNECWKLVKYVSTAWRSRISTCVWHIGNAKIMFHNDVHSSMDALVFLSLTFFFHSHALEMYLNCMQLGLPVLHLLPVWKRSSFCELCIRIWSCIST